MVRHAVKRPVSTIVRHGGAPRKRDSRGQQIVLRSRAIGFLLQGDLAVGRSATRLYGALLEGQGGGGSRGVRITAAASAPSPILSRSDRAVGRIGVKSMPPDTIALLLCCLVFLAC